MAGERSILPDEIVLPADARGMSEIRHELRTYLNHIVGYGEMVLDDAETRQWPVGRRNMEEVISAAGELTEQISNLLHALDDGDRNRCADVVNSMVQPALLRIKRVTEHAMSDAPRSGSPETKSDLNRIDRSCQYFLEALGRGLQPRNRSNVDRTPSPPVIDRTATERSSDGSTRAAITSAHLLAVDDNEANLTLLKRFCERRGHFVTLARTGEEALELLKDRRFDLVILDIMLPGINGFQVLESIRDSDTMDVPVIVLSSLDDMESMVASLRLGAEDFLRKPFMGEVLEARIQAQLEKKNLSSPATSLPISSGDGKGPNPHGLSDREIQVLSHLAMGKSNREIGEELFITENTVTRHVSNIFTKADLGNRAEAGVYAVRHGLIQLDPRMG